MVDINKEAEQVLIQLPYTLSFFYPEEFNEFPIVSFYDINTNGSFDSDNKKDMVKGYVNVDIWTLEPSQGGKIAGEITELMESSGWWCELNRSLPKTDGVYHRTMRWGKEFILN